MPWMDCKACMLNFDAYLGIYINVELTYNYLQYVSQNILGYIDSIDSLKIHTTSYEIEDGPRTPSKTLSQ
jgi:hypothetical protein